ncbi:MAG TPA: HpcH/HpaI aldolase/citrate lyase family protein [Jatrophihabitantaceae bacterium]|nr:HpcH/HpaI aldolase/citrate lyase family protein [Jatrophihabitantaceae bacterium]
MRHFDNLSADETSRLFLRTPESFDSTAEPNMLATALGATLYCPGTRTSLARDLSRRAAEGVLSFVVCLEDSVADGELRQAEHNAIAQLRDLAHEGDLSAMVFVRVRSASQIPMLVDRLDGAHSLLTGFVLPKFTEESGSEQLDAVVEAQERIGRRLFAMPVLEAPEMIFAESRIDALTSTRQLLDKYRDNVLAVRVGATDLASAYGLRRSRDLTTYDVRVIADAISDIVNVFGRADGGYVVTGPVWEYFAQAERMFKPQLRTTPFVEHAERTLRARLIANDLDGLIREIALDRANGLLGKSVIHPSHVAPVHALSVVTHEEYLDATDVLSAGSTGGAAASPYGNKMNESKPHLAWAERTVLRSRAFGVAAEDVSFVDLLGACLSS